MTSIPTQALPMTNSARQDAGVGVGIGLVLALLIVAYGSSRLFVGVFDLWQTQEAFSHGWVILLMALYLLWLQRREIALDRLQTFWLALIPIAGIGLLQSTGVLNLEMFLLPSLLLCIVILFVGPRAAVKYGFPLLLLHAALPGWGPALPVLHKMTVFAVEQMLTITGITAFFDGALVTIPSGNFIIEDGCSGMNYFIVGTTIASIYAYLGPRSWRLAVISLSLGILLSIIANWIRVYGVILIGHFTEMESPIVSNHGTFGWFVFAGAMVLFYVLMARLFPDEMFLTKNSPEKISSKNEVAETPATKFGVNVVVVLLSLLVTLQLGSLTNWLLTEDSRLAPLELPATNALTGEPNSWNPQVEGATEINTTTINGVTLHLARFDRQDSPALVQNDEIWADGKMWRILDWRTKEIPSGPVQRIDLRSDTEKVLVWAWYGVDEYQGAGRTTTRLRQAASRYLGTGTGYLVNLSVTCLRADCATGEAALAAFMGTTGSELMTQVIQSMRGSTSLETN